MDAATEAQVGGLPAADAKRVRVREAAPVTIRRADHQPDALASWDRDPIGAPDPEAVLQDPAVEILERRIPAQDLLDHDFGAHRTGHQRLPLIRVSGKRRDAIRRGVDRGLVAGHQQDHRGRGDLIVVESASAGFGHRQRRQEIVRGIAPTIRDEGMDEVQERSGGLVRARLHGRGRIGLVHRHHRVRQVDDPGPFGRRHADEVADDAEREGLGDVADDVECPALPGDIEGRQDRPLDPGALCLHRARRECPQDEATEHRMVGRLDRQQIPALEPGEGRVVPGAPGLGADIEARSIADVRPEATIPPRLMDVGMAGDEVEPHGRRIPDRPGLAQQRVARVGIEGGRRIRGIEGRSHALSAGSGGSRS